MHLVAEKDDMINKKLQIQAEFSDCFLSKTT